jgi:hypothetical protein
VTSLVSFKMFLLRAQLVLLALVVIDAQFREGGVRGLTDTWEAPRDVELSPLLGECKDFDESCEATASGGGCAEQAVRDSCCVSCASQSVGGISECEIEVLDCR